MDDQACRVLVLTMLAAGIRAARKGNRQEIARVRGPESRQWAEALGLEWPPHNLANLGE